MLLRRSAGSITPWYILYFTGYSQRLFDEKGILWENEAFIEKPVPMKGLLEAVSLLPTPQHQ